MKHEALVKHYVQQVMDDIAENGTATLRISNMPQQAAEVAAMLKKNGVQVKLSLDGEFVVLKAS